MARQNLLLVDGYARNLRVLEVSLRKAGFSITTAGSAEQGLQYLEHAEPDLIISDTQLRGGDGFEFCRAVKQDPRWAAIPFIFLTSAGELEDKVRGLELGVEDYLTKPIYVKEVMTRVKMLLQRKQQERIGRKDARTKFSGQLADMAIVDLLQTIEISRKSGTIELETDLGNATVWFRDGKVVDAQMGRLAAASAVYRLLGISDGTFEVEFRAIGRVGVIEDATQTLLMEGMRRVDEWVRLLEGLPPLDHILTRDERLLAVRPEPLPSAEATLLRRFDGRRTIIEIIDDTGVDDLAALQMIGGLYFEGLLTDELGGDDDELVEPMTGATASTEAWNPALTLAGVPPLSPIQVDTVVPVVTAADLPPLPAFPLPFPNLSANADHDDVLVGGIPEDVRELPAEQDDDRVLAPTTSRQRITDKAPPSAIIEALTVHRLEAIDGHIAVPMGTARAEAFGELQSHRGDGVPRRTHPHAVDIHRRSFAVVPKRSRELGRDSGRERVAAALRGVAHGRLQ
jgi:DNA-binding response OmpR family regulator